MTTSLSLYKGEKVNLGFEDILYSEIASTLKEVKKDAFYSKEMASFYPYQDREIKKENKTLSFSTNDILRLKIQDAMRERPSDENLISLTVPIQKQIPYILRMMILFM